MLVPPRSVLATAPSISVAQPTAPGRCCGCTKLQHSFEGAATVSVERECRTASAPKAGARAFRQARPLEQRRTSGGTAGNTTLPTPGNALPEIISVACGVMRNSLRPSESACTNIRRNAKFQSRPREESQHFQLQNMRGAPGAGNAAKGLYLGAYALLEDLRPSTARLQPVQLPPDVAENFAGASPLRQDLANRGYIHAPSLPHAQTAAVLRSGYLANATAANPSTMAVNLSSDRVRLALSVLEGIRNGQTFGALLGYQIERGLHDDHGLVEVDKLIYPMRKAFPLAADAISSTKTDPGVPIEAIEARNVMDGMKLVMAIRSGGAAIYPFGQALPA